MLESEIRSDSASNRSTTSPASIRFVAVLCQHRSIMSHTLFETSWWSSRGGLAPLSINWAAAASDMPKNGALPVRVCFGLGLNATELCEGIHTSQATIPNAYMSQALVGTSRASRDDAGQTDSKAWLGGTWPKLVPPFGGQYVEWGRMEAEPRPAIRTVSSTSTNIFA